MSDEVKEQTDDKEEGVEASSADTNAEDQNSDKDSEDGSKETLETSATDTRIKELTEDNARLGRLLEATLANRQSQQQQVVRQEVQKLQVDRESLTPTERVLVDEVERLRGENQAHRGVLGNQADEFDRLEILSDSKLAPHYRNLKDKIESYRKSRAEYGVYLTRKEALSFIALEEGVSLVEKPVENKRPSSNPPKKPISSGGGGSTSTEKPLA